MWVSTLLSFIRRGGSCPSDLDLRVTSVRVSPWALTTTISTLHSTPQGKLDHLQCLPEPTIQLFLFIPFFLLTCMLRFQVYIVALLGLNTDFISYVREGLELQLLHQLTETVEFSILLKNLCPLHSQSLFSK
uniref:Uncharacterized protein n=1 Tax=Physcomitrium patens TaxID=3218 RepID=A0A2K1KXA9_PHYPA|nr:hypothetical protein PHYPA_005419 [Physcomitrium patens]